MQRKLIRLSVQAILFCLILAASGLSATAQYTCDNLNRLVQVQYEDGTIIHYTYDAAGNRLTQEVTSPTPPEAPDGSSLQTGQGPAIPADDIRLN